MTRRLMVLSYDLMYTEQCLKVARNVMLLKVRYNSFDIAIHQAIQRSI